jgi:hypothetical protein
MDDRQALKTRLNLLKEVTVACGDKKKIMITQVMSAELPHQIDKERFAATGYTRIDR